MLIIVCGSIGRSLTGGQAWANLQYLLGFQRLGHEVYYLEDCGEWSEVYNWGTGHKTTGLEYPAGYIRQCLESVGLKSRWAYRVGDQSAGLTLSQIRELCNEAHLMLIRGIPLLQWREEYSRPKRRVFIDVDPGFTQISLANGDRAFVETVDRSEAVFTYGQRIGLSDCPIPNGGHSWLKTVPPVVISHWPVSDRGQAEAFTSLMRWRGVKDLEFQGQVYGQKDREFPRFLDLPRRSAQSFRLALIGGGARQCSDHGWEVMPGWQASRTTETYQTYIQQSRAEFGVAKHCYVRGRVGWFSDRSVCYLASGRPVLLQDTQLDDWLPTGRGVVCFRDLESAVQGVADINENYDEHRQAARRIAEEVFASDQVLTRLLDDAME